MNKIAFFCLLFVATSALGIYVGASFIPQVGDINPMTGGDVDDPFGAAYLLLVIAIGTIVLLLVLKYYKGNILYRLFEVYIIFVGTLVVWDTLFFDFFNFTGLESESAYLLLTFGCALLCVLARFVWRNFFVKNITLAIAIAGAGGVLGAMVGIVPALILALVLTAYDYISVFKTKHMVGLADGAIENDLPVMFQTSSKGIKTGARKKKSSGKGGDIIALGTGDIAIPLILFVGVLRSTGSFGLVITTVIGALLGLAFTIYYVTNVKRIALPALPPIIGGSVVGLGIGFLLFSV